MVNTVIKVRSTFNHKSALQVIKIVQPFPVKAECLFWKCLSRFDFLLFANFSPHINQTGESLSSTVKANKSVHEALKVLFSSEIFLFFHRWLTGSRPLKKCTCLLPGNGPAGDVYFDPQNIKTCFIFVLQDSTNSPK